MGKALDKFKQGAKKGSEKVDELRNIKVNDQPKLGGRYHQKENKIMGDMHDIEEEDFNEGLPGGNYPRDDWDDEVGIRPAQKPESFHHFILENKYQDLERSIRGYKDVFDKETQTWKTKRKELHCFTDEEAENILRTAQSHLSTDIKLGRIKKEKIGEYMMAIFKQLQLYFRRISEYQYGRYATYEIQGTMKSQNLKIFLELWTRIQANYSMSIEGQENKETHGSVKGQESLQSTASNEEELGSYT